MSQYDITTLYKVFPALLPQDATSSADFNSSMINRTGYKSCMFVFAWTDGGGAETLAISLYEGETSNIGSATLVDPSKVILQPSTIDLSTRVSGIVKFGYRGNKTYIGFKIARTGTVDTLTCSCVALLGDIGRVPLS